ncbi:MAG: hypothetical protein ACTSW7_00665 [Candidatus Thorarchaeota archaeon]
MSNNLITNLPREELIEWRKLLRQEIAKNIRTQSNNVTTLRKIQSEIDRRKNVG